MRSDTAPMTRTLSGSGVDCPSHAEMARLWVQPADKRRLWAITPARPPVRTPRLRTSRSQVRPDGLHPETPQNTESTADSSSHLLLRRAATEAHLACPSPLESALSQRLPPATKATLLAHRGCRTKLRTVRHPVVKAIETGAVGVDFPPPDA